MQNFIRYDKEMLVKGIFEKLIKKDTDLKRGVLFFYLTKNIN